MPKVSPVQKRFWLWGVLWGIGVICLDQASKGWVFSKLLKSRESLEIFPFFEIVLVFNRGISFGFFSSGPAFSVYLLMGSTMLVSLVLILWLWRAETLLMGVGLGLILGGALGNLIDRVRFSWVIDFLHVHWGPYSFPAFNVADTAITLGAALILYESFFLKKH